MRIQVGGFTPNHLVFRGDFYGMVYLFMALLIVFSAQWFFGPLRA
jgi:hypothetical protein